MRQPGRGVAQPGSASHWGCGGRWFESSRPDHSFTGKSSFLMSHEPMLMMMQASAQPSGMTTFLVQIFPFLLIFVIFYMLVLRPQNRKLSDHRATIAAVKKGDDVITGGGIRGKVTKVTDDEAEVEIAQGVKIRVIKSTISQVLSPSTKPAND